MRRPSAIVLPLLAALAGAGCGGGATEPAQDLRVTVAVAPAAFRAGDTVRVTTEVANVGRRSRTIDANVCPGAFVVRTAAGAAVAPAWQVCTDVLILRALAPGERITFAGQWTGVVRAGGAEVTPTYASPGAYVVRGLVRIVDGAAVEGEPAAVQVLP